MLLTTYQPDIESIGGSLTASALVAAVPLATLFVMLGALRITAWISGLTALGAALLVAIAGFGMPVDQALLAGSQGQPSDSSRSCGSSSMPSGSTT